MNSLGRPELEEQRVGGEVIREKSYWSLAQIWCRYEGGTGWDGGRRHEKEAILRF